MQDYLIEFKGSKTGPTSVILAGTHGDEAGGINALKKMLPEFKIDRGRVLVGFGNPLAIKKKVRFIEINLNRMFKPDKLFILEQKRTYEYARAQFLKAYFDQADALLDLHCSFVKQSRPFIVCEDNSYDIARHLPVNLIVTGLDQIQPGGTDYYMNSHGKVGICLECGYLGDNNASQIANEGIYDFLGAMGHISRKPKIRKQSLVKMYELYITKTANFKLAKPFKDFEKLSDGQTIGTDGGREIKAPKDSIILFARNMNKAGEESFALGKVIPGQPWSREQREAIDEAATRLARIFIEQIESEHKKKQR
ncbi:MAG: succinylglutamate desuccinylase/aspartoacylase family protein [Candidatus Nealsonbacteria bacterium DGGOD1a]|jgi:Succinylglutamate desuccinylase|nr:MAG: succinylglutamate desuccinylase/aspartoacylase family protein [Candidatus Nealsonbacteria bacterium DGGOD1a]